MAGIKYAAPHELTWRLSQGTRIPDCETNPIGGYSMEIKSIDDLEIVTIPTRFDAYAAHDVEATFKDLVGKGTRRIICDFSQTEYVASAGLRVLLGTAKNLQKQEGLLVLCSLGAYVREIFDTAGFTQIFKIYASTDEAIRSLQKK